jgi:hypothetical protein
VNAVFAFVFAAGHFETHVDEVQKVALRELNGRVFEAQVHGAGFTKRDLGHVLGFVFYEMKRLAHV